MMGGGGRGRAGRDFGHCEKTATKLTVNHISSGSNERYNSMHHMYVVCDDTQVSKTANHVFLKVPQGATFDLKYCVGQLL